VKLLSAPPSTREVVIVTLSGSRFSWVTCLQPAGTDLYRAMLEDFAEVHRRIPHERMRYALEIPYSARENSSA
jgi:hypothetical protein